MSSNKWKAIALSALSKAGSGGDCEQKHQTKSVEITENGSTVVVPDSGYTGMTSVTVNTKVPNPVVELAGGWKGTPVIGTWDGVSDPTEEQYVDGIYFNTELSVEEVVAIVDSVAPSYGFLEHSIMFYNASSGPVVIMFGRPRGEERLVVVLNLNTEEILFVSSKELSEATGIPVSFEGWNPNFNGSFTGPLAIARPGVSMGSYMGTVPSAEAMTALSSLISLTPFEKVTGASKELSGTYDGSTVEVTENGELDIGALLDEKKLPLKVEVAVEGSGEGAVVEIPGGTPVISTWDGKSDVTPEQIVDGMYFNTSLSIEEVLNIMSAATPTFDRGILAVAALSYPDGENMSVMGALMDGMCILVDMVGQNVLFSYPKEAAEALAGPVDFEGWNPNFNGMIPGPFVLMPPGTSTGSYMPVTSSAEAMTALSGLISLSPNFEPVVKPLSGTYDGAPVSVYEKKVDIEALLNQQKLPLQVMYQGETSDDFIRYLVDYAHTVPPYTLCRMTTERYDDLLSFIKTQGMIENMEGMFGNCATITEIPQLNTSYVVNMRAMFEECYALTNIPILDTRRVNTMRYMFGNCHSLVTIPLLDTKEVHDMSSMFDYCTSLTSVPLLDTSKVVTTVAMFQGCRALTEVPEIDTRGVKDMYQMFFGCTTLANVPRLDARNAVTMHNMFTSCKKLTTCMFKNIPVSFQVGSGSSYGHLLTMESLLNLLNETRYYTDGTERTLTVGSANLAKFAGDYEYVKLTGEIVDVDDNPCLLVDGCKVRCTWCASTDEGAMTVAQYMSDKGWTIA